MTDTLEAIVQETKVWSIEQIVAMPGNSLKYNSVRKALTADEKKGKITGWRYPIRDATGRTAWPRAFEVTFPYLAGRFNIPEDRRDEAVAYFNDTSSLEQGILKGPIQQNHDANLARRRGKKGEGGRNGDTTALAASAVTPGSDAEPPVHAQPAAHIPASAPQQEITVSYLPRLPQRDGITYNRVALHDVDISLLDQLRTVGYFHSNGNIKLPLDKGQWVNCTVNLSDMEIGEIDRPKILLEYLRLNITRDIPFTIYVQAHGKRTASLSDFPLSKINMDAAFHLIHADTKVSLPLDELVMLAANNDARQRLIKAHQPELLKKSYTTVAGHRFDAGNQLEPLDPQYTAEQLAGFFGIQLLTAHALYDALAAQGRLYQSQLINALQKQGTFLFVDQIVAKAMESYRSQKQKAPFAKKVKNSSLPTEEEILAATVERIYNIISESFRNDAKPANIGSNQMPVYIVSEKELSAFCKAAQITVYDTQNRNGRTPISFREL